MARNIGIAFVMTSPALADEWSAKESMPTGFPLNSEWENLGLKQLARRNLAIAVIEATVRNVTSCRMPMFNCWSCSWCSGGASSQCQAF